MIPSDHPYWFVKDVVERSKVAALTMSYYSYQPQTVADERTIWQVSVEDFLRSEVVEEAIAHTPDGRELALHSLVTLASGENRHLVMVDMSTSAKAHLEKLRAYLGDHFFQKMAWYSSGRSFHGYGEGLLSFDDWVKFMGLLLLANKPRMEPTVDPRWIGHRLLAGYSALRWTRNTASYLVPPARIDAQRAPKPASIEVGALGRQLRR